MKKEKIIRFCRILSVLSSDGSTHFDIHSSYYNPPPQKKNSYSFPPAPGIHFRNTVQKYQRHETYFVTNQKRPTRFSQQPSLIYWLTIKTTLIPPTKADPTLLVLATDPSARNLKDRGRVRDCPEHQQRHQDVSINIAVFGQWRQQMAAIVTCSRLL